MTISDDENESLAQFLESEFLSETSDQEEAEEEVKRSENERIEETESDNNNNNNNNNKRKKMRIESGLLSKVPPEIFIHIFKFLSSEDLMACSLVCRFMNCAASDESLWRRLYCLRWGILPPSNRLSDSAWKKLYIQRDEEEMVNLVRNCQPEFKEYYIQMHASKRSQAPLPSQVKDDRIILDKTVTDQVTIWKSRKGLTDNVVTDHTCSGETCSYYRIGDVFVCEKTGNVHVCGDTCREVVVDPVNELLVCTVSGLSFDRLCLPSEPEQDVAEGGVTDEAEPFMGSGRFARAYLLGYNCDNENELEATLRFC